MLEDVEAHGHIVDTIGLRQGRPRLHKLCSQIATGKAVACESQRWAVHVYQRDVITMGTQEQGVGAHPRSEVIDTAPARGGGIPANKVADRFAIRISRPTRMPLHQGPDVGVGRSIESEYGLRCLRVGSSP